MSGKDKSLFMWIFFPSIAFLIVLDTILVMIRCSI